MSLLVDHRGRAVYADPHEQSFEDAQARCRRALAACIYGAGPPGTILDVRGVPFARTGGIPAAPPRLRFFDGNPPPYTWPGPRPVNVEASL